MAGLGNVDGVSGSRRIIILETAVNRSLVVAGGRVKDALSAVSG